MARARTAPSDSTDELSQTASAEEGAVGPETNAPVERTAAGLARILVVDKSLSENLLRSILPVVQEVSEGLLRAVDPVLHQYRDDVGRAMEEQIRQAFPATRKTPPNGANGDWEGGAGATESPDETAGPPVQDNSPTESDTQDDGTERSNATKVRVDEPVGDAAATTSDHPPGGKEMTSEAAKSTEAEPDKAQASDDQTSTGKAPQQNGKQRADGNAGSSEKPTYVYDPQAALRAGLLRLATDWKEAGSTYQAMHAYMEVIRRYPQSGAAAAATEGLVDLADRLQKQGKFYAATNIYDKLDATLA